MKRQFDVEVEKLKSEYRELLSEMKNVKDENKTLKEELEKRLLPQYKGTKPAVLQVELANLVLRSAKETVATDLRNQLFGNIFLADIQTQELIAQSGVRVFDHNFKANGNIGVLLTATANNKSSFKRRFQPKLAGICKTVDVGIEEFLVEVLG